jgi:S1-C subfamily serine protease
VEASPAQAAGLQVGDIILKVGENTLRDDLPYLNALSQLKPGDKVDIQYSRGGKVQDTTVAVTAR